MKNRIKGWDKKMLSKGGKKILLKTVAQSLPNYAMSIFLLPKQLCTNMERLMSKFWWRSSSDKDRSICWMSWKRMCRRKAKGGLGFRQLYEFNVALLGKQGWRLISDEHSLVSRLYKARYYPNESFLTAKVGNNPSYIWRSILEAHILLKKGSVRRISSGKEVSILNDPWLWDVENPYVITNHAAIEGQSVSSLMITNQKVWDINLIRDVFVDRDANLILVIPLDESENDLWYWNKERMGKYTVKSAYLSMCAEREDNNEPSVIWKTIWSYKIPHKIKIFIWRALSDCLPTKEQLCVRRVNVLSFCPVCNEEQETIFHCLMLCSFSK